MKKIREISLKEKELLTRLRTKDLMEYLFERTKNSQIKKLYKSIYNNLNNQA